MALSYKCPSVGCYSVNSPSTNVLIKSLQTAINRLSGSTGFGLSPIATDGVFGKGSLAALSVALFAIKTQPDRFNTAREAELFFDAINVPEDVMQFLESGSLVGTLNHAADVLGAPAQVTPSKDPPSKLPMPMNPGAAAMLLQVKVGKPALNASVLDTFRNLPLWAKVALGAGVVGGVAFVATKKKKPKAHALPGQ